MLERREDAVLARMMGEKDSTLHQDLNAAADTTKLKLKHLRMTECTYSEEAASAKAEGADLFHWLVKMLAVIDIFFVPLNLSIYPSILP